MKFKLIGLTALSTVMAGCAANGSAVDTTSTAVSSVMDLDALVAECERIEQIYPRLMLATMLEGPMMCGDPYSGEEFPCDEGETAEEKAAREERLRIRTEQEAAAKKADMACDAFEEDLANMERRELAYQGVRAAQAVNIGK